MGIAVTWQNRRDTGGSSGSVAGGGQPTFSAGSSSSKKKEKIILKKLIFFKQKTINYHLFNFFHKHVQIHHLYTFYAFYHSELVMIVCATCKTENFYRATEIVDHLFLSNEILSRKQIHSINTK